jgi:predicted dinucleotide-binding enzyme
MTISILGTGNMATGLAVLFAKAGHTVTLGSRDAEKAKTVASKSGNGIVGAALADAAGKADLVVLAVPFDAAADIISAAGDLTGKTLVDITNPMTAD